MNAPTVILIVIIAVLAVFAARRMYRSFSGKGGCHGGGGGGEAKRVKVADLDESHYPYSQNLKVSGMTCDHCVCNVENALNSIEGTWARVDLTSGTAHVLSKAPVDEGRLHRAVTEAGYYVPSVR